jgi:DNA-binding IclR family transcriptional regulator
VSESNGEISAVSQEDRYHSRTIERALDALDAFDLHRSLSLKQLGGITGQPEASLYRVLLTLQKRGYLSQNEDGTYQLARKVLYGRVLDEAESIRKLARPVLDELVRRFDETASLSYCFKHYIQVLDSVETFQSFRIANRPGRIIPPHCSAMGKSILAFQAHEATDVLLEAYGLSRRTEHSICDRQALREELEMVRQRGWACDREESTLGGICFGAPIFDPSGRPIAALSVSSPTQRMTPAREAQIQEAVLQAAKRVTTALEPGGK